MKRGVLVSFSLLLACAAAFAAQTALPIRARAWPSKVTVGGEVRLILEVAHPKGFRVKPPDPKIAVAPFEIKRVRALPARENGGLVRENFEVIVTIFQVGAHQIPPIPLDYADESGAGGRLFGPAVPIEVVSVLKGAEPGDIRPIKDVISLDTRFVVYFSEAFLALALSVWLAVKIYLRKRKKTRADPESLLPPHERALLELERLEKKGFLEAGRLKEYYSELSSILKRYLERRFGFEALELTTSEIVRGIKERELDAGARDKIRDVLENSDLVKFANFVPARLAAERLGRSVVEVVELTQEAAQAKESG